MLSFLGKIGSFIMTPLYYLIRVVLVGFHQVLGAVFGSDTGVSWALSIIGLTMVIRAALIPLFVKQIKSSRNMQLLQPKVKELQKKYGHDRERLAQETMSLYRETRTNPFASCLPLLRADADLHRAVPADRPGREERQRATACSPTTQAQSFADAKLFGAKISVTFTNAGGDATCRSSRRSWWSR